MNLDRDSHRAREGRSASRNPFGTMDVPEPYDREVSRFAASAKLEGSPNDENAEAWNALGHTMPIDGLWSSRWNGGADPTIPGDAPAKWKAGVAEVKADGEHVFLFFTWDHGARRGLIEAKRDGRDRLVGKYINLTDPKIVRPWIGLIVNDRRIDGRWTGGRLDFRR